jgi:hypothetical protein
MLRSGADAERVQAWADLAQGAGLVVVTTQAVDATLRVLLKSS